MGRLMRRGRLAEPTWAFFVLVFGAALAVGCQGTSDDGISSDAASPTDARSDVRADGRTDVDRDGADAGGDAVDGGGETGVVDGGGDAGDDGDRDGDGVPDEDDNCPDEANKEQADRDRDGVGDACDHLPFIHDEKNPKSFDAVAEKEDENDNDGPREGEGYDLELPFAVEGSVGPVDEEGDIDYYSFDVDEPTALLLRVVPQGSQMWVGAITLGYEARNADVRPALFGPGPGQNGVRGLFLPVPGSYSVAVSDLRNFLPDSQQADVPNNGELEYEMSVSAVPLPEPTPVSVPDRKTRTYDGQLHTFEVDTSSIDDLKVDGKGVSIGGDAIQDPLLHVYDEKKNRTLSYTIGPEINDTQEVSLTTKLADDRTSVTVVEDFQRQLRNTSSVVQFAEATVDSEFETIQQEQNDRPDELVWLQPGQEVDGRINEAWNTGQNSRSPDTDYYLINTSRGQAIRVTVEPDSGSDLKPEVAVGNYFQDPQQGSQWFDRRGHEVSAPESAGDSRSVEFLYGGRSDGANAIRVRHGPNEGADDPVGGSDYGYTVRVETFTPSPKKVGSLPATEDVSFDAGSFGLLSFERNKKGTILKVDPKEPDNADILPITRVHRTSDWGEVKRDLRDFQFRTGQKGTYWVDVRDFRGRGTGGEKMTLEFEEVTVESLSNPPVTKQDKLDTSGGSDLYRFTIPSPGNYDLRIKTQDFLPRVEIFALPSFDRLGGGFGGDDVLQFGRAGTYAVEVSALGDSTGSYTLGLAEVQPDQLGSPPASTTDTVDDEPFPDWYEMPVDKDKGYEIRYEMTAQSDFDGRLAVYDPSDLGRIELSADETLRFGAEDNGKVLIALSDDDQRGDPSFQYELEAETLTIDTLSPGGSDSGQLSSGKDAAYFAVDAPASTLTVEATASSGAWTPQTRLLDGDDLDRMNDPKAHRGLVRHATAETRTYGVRVTARDDSRSGPLSFDIRASVDKPGSASAESEPNGTAAEANGVGSLPAVVDGELGAQSGGSRDKKDRFAVDLKAGQKIWALASSQSAGQRRRLRPEMTLFDPDGNRRADDRRDGDGTFPALYAERVEQSGTWQVELKSRRNRDGNYYLYVFATSATTVAENEPNDARGDAHALGTVDETTHVSATISSQDPKDIYTFDLTRDLDDLNVELEGGKSGHNLRLLDGSFNEIAADGPDHGGGADPSIGSSNLSAGTYFLELNRGGTSNTSQPTVVIWQNP